MSTAGRHTDEEPSRFGTRFECEVILTHSANTSTADSDDHLQGWRDCLGRPVATYRSAES